jgi:UMF1 family MFS transporter
VAVAAIVKNDKRTIFGWAMYDWANSAYITTAGAIVAAFFTGEIVPDEGYAGMSGETLWAYGVSIGSLLLFLAMPVLGAVADFAGAKRAFLRAFAFVGAITTMAVPFVPTGAVPAFVGVFLVTQVGFSGSFVFSDSYLPHIATDDTIDRVSSRGYALGYVGGGLYLLLALVLILLSGDDGVTGLSTTTAARISIFGSGVWWLGFTLFALRRLPEPGRPEQLPPELSGRSSVVAYARVGFARTVGTARRLRRFPHLMLFVLAFFFYNDGVQTVIDVSGAYAEDTLRLAAEEIVIAFLIVQFVAFFGALGFGVLADRIGTRPAIMVSLGGWSLISVGGYLLPAGETTPLYVLAVFIGMVLGGVQALSRSLYGSMIPDEASAEFYGFFSVFSKFSAIFGPLVFAIVSDRADSGRPAILSIIAFFVIGMAILSRVDVDAARASRDEWHFAGVDVDISRD